MLIFKIFNKWCLHFSFTSDCLMVLLSKKDHLMVSYCKNKKIIRKSPRLRNKQPFNSIYEEQKKKNYLIIRRSAAEKHLNFICDVTGWCHILFHLTILSDLEIRSHCRIRSLDIFSLFWPLKHVTANILNFCKFLWSRNWRDSTNLLFWIVKNYARRQKCVFELVTCQFNTLLLRIWLFTQKNVLLNQQKFPLAHI